MSADVVRAAGCVVWRPTATGIEVLLVHRPRYDDWSLPKGKLGPARVLGGRRLPRGRGGDAAAPARSGLHLATSTYIDRKGRTKEVR